VELFAFDSQSQVFHSEEDCENYLMRLRWTNGFCCPRCDHHHAYKIQTRRLLECSECKMQVSFTAGTVMHKSKLPLFTWFRAIQLLNQNELTYTPSILSIVLGINYRSARLLLQKIQIAYLKRENRRELFAKTKESTSQIASKLLKVPSEMPSPLQLQEVISKLSKQSSKPTHLRTYFENKSKQQTYRNLHSGDDRGKGLYTPFTFEKWMRMLISVTLYPVFLRCYRLPD
jgi:hypothetical protein